MREFDVCVIGAGPGGTAAAVQSSTLGAKVGLVERGETGGACLNRGCIPTKSRLRSAALFEELNRSQEFGISAVKPSIDLKSVNRRSAEVVSCLKTQLEQSLRTSKVEMIRGEAVFLSRNSILAGSEEIRSKSFIIASGSIPRRLTDISSDRKRIFYSEEILGLEDLPPDVTIIGAGPIGCEFASFFRALGAKVVLMETLQRILPKEDKDISNRLEGIFKSKGIEVTTGVPQIDIGRITSGIVLISVGRVADIGGLSLEKAQVLSSGGRIEADEYLRTSADNIFAAGDCVGRYNLAHAATEEGIVAAKNAAGIKTRMDYSLVPMCVYSFPECASVGLTADAAEESGISAVSGRAFFSASGRAQAAGEPEGFVKLVAGKGDGKIIGAQILGHNASEMIGAISLAIKGGLSVEQVSGTIQAHPTFTESIREAAFNVLRRSR